MKRVLLIISFSFFLLGCSNQSINPKDSAQTAQYLQSEFNLDGDLNLKKIDYNKYEKRDGYELSEDVIVLLNEDKNVSHIYLSNITKKQVEKIVQSIDFPPSDIINDILTLENFDTENYSNNVGFDYQNDTGLSIVRVKGTLTDDAPSEDTYFLSLYYYATPEYLEEIDYSYNEAPW